LWFDKLAFSGNKNNTKDQIDSRDFHSSKEGVLEVNLVVKERGGKKEGKRGAAISQKLGKGLTKGGVD